jgi:hypothetical protein
MRSQYPLILTEVGRKRSTEYFRLKARLVERHKADIRSGSQAAKSLVDIPLITDVQQSQV